MIGTLLSDPALRDRAQALRADRQPEEVIARVTWSVLAEPGDSVAGALVKSLGAVSALHRAFQASPVATSETSRAQLAESTSPTVAAQMIRDGMERWQPRARTQLVRDAIDAALRINARLLLPGDESWPEGVDDLGHHAPLVLWARGSTEPLVAPASVAIVGARAATAYGEHLATELAADLASTGIVVISGGAYGIDGAAHRAALRSGGTTLAFLAGGVDRLYPAGHTTLLERIIESGALISEVPPGTAPTKWRFLARNRLISAASGATVVVEAGARSGSLNTASHAASIGRPLGAVPGPVTSAASTGCHRLLREYDARCITQASDVRELLGIGPQPAVRPGAPNRDQTKSMTDPDLVRLHDALSSRTPRSVDDIARRSGLAVSHVETLLGLVSLDGSVTRDERGWRRALS